MKYGPYWAILVEGNDEYEAGWIYGTPNSAYYESLFKGPQMPLMGNKEKARRRLNSIAKHNPNLKDRLKLVPIYLSDSVSGE